MDRNRLDILFESYNQIFLRCIKEMVSEIEKYIQKDKYISSHFKFPIRKDNKKNGMPSFSQSMFDNGAKNYASVFTTNKSDIERIQLKSLKSYCELMNSFFKNEQVREENIFLKEMSNNHQELIVQNTILSLVDNYMSIYYVKDKEFDESNAKKLLREIFYRMFNKTLEIKVVIPILLLDFEVDKYEFDENVKIRKMTEEEQLSRYATVEDGSIRELFIVEESLYILELNHYQVKNDNFIKVSYLMNEPNAYPLQIIDKWFASLRIVTGFDTGYAQLLSIPIDWRDITKANLLPMEGIIMNKFNYNLVKNSKWNSEVKKVKKEQLDSIKEVYQYLNKKSSKSMEIAVKRWNRCCLREEIDDKTIDAVIAIESLLTEDDLGEITYKVSNRAAVVIATVCEGKYTANEIRNAMKKIYSYRSKVVHGSQMRDKDINIKVNNEVTKNATDLAIEFLRYIILSITKNNNFNKASKIDEYMCNIVDHINC